MSSIETYSKGQLGMAHLTPAQKLKAEVDQLREDQLSLTATIISERYKLDKVTDTLAKLIDKLQRERSDNYGLTK